MRKVLVADDEVRVCKLICNLVDWAAFDMQIVATAHDGLSAFAAVEREKPDLVVTDIRMPGLDGLALIAKMRESAPDTDIIIISGHRDFEYAQQAIEYGANAYLLKPVNKEELETALRKIRVRHDKREQEAERAENLLSRLHQDSGQLRAMFFGDWLLNTGREPLDAGQANERYHYQFGSGIYRAYVVKLDFPCPEEYSQAACMALREKLAELLCRYLRPLSIEEERSFAGTRILGFVHYARRSEVGLRRQLLACVNEMGAQRDMFRHAQITMGLGGVKASLGELPDSMEEATMAVEQRLVDKSGQRVLERYDTGMPDLSILQQEYKSRLAGIVELLDDAAVPALVAELAQSVMRTSALCGAGLLLAVTRAFELFAALMRSAHGPTEDMEGAAAGFAEQLELVHDGAGVFFCLQAAMQRHIALRRGAMRQAVTRPIANARQYILAHYREPVTLEEIAGVAGFNASYFSALFKKECGETFLEYLSGVRIAKAKELLRSTDLPVADVCAQVGYTDVKHFNRTFKKLANVTPTEFRKLYS